MTLARLALKDAWRSEFRSVTVFACALVIAALVVTAALVVRGADASLDRTRDRLGADIVVVPQGTASSVQTALLMGDPTSVWMPERILVEVAAVEGVAEATPQMYLATLEGASCCSVGSMFIVAFDPATDFTVQPWLEESVGGGLATGEGVGGRHVVVPEEGIRIYGHPIELRGTLEPTGSNLDQSLFITFATAREVARGSVTAAEKPLVIPDDSVSSVLVRVDDGADPDVVAGAIVTGVPGTSVVLRPGLFGDFQNQLGGLEGTLAVLLGLALSLAGVAVAAVFTLAAHERRREVGVWRALGATRGQVALSFVIQAGALAVAGGVTGAVLAALGVYLFRDAIIARIGVPFLFPSLPGLALLVAGGAAASTCIAGLAALVPALRSARQDPSLAMRE